MAYLNKIMLIGNLGKDPEIRVSQSGTKKVSFSIATTEKFKDKNTGEVKNATEWHNVIAWGATADLIQRLDLRKGVSLYVEGKQTHRSYDDPSGQKRYVSEVNMQSFQILTARSAQAQSQGQAESADGAQEYQGDYVENSDDLPF